MFIQGPQVSQLEAALSRYTGAKHAVSCANGTDALTIALLAAGVKAGDVVFTPSFTYVASAEASAIIGAVPCFVDIDHATYNICPNKLEEAVKHAKFSLGLNVKAVIAVDLFGNPFRYDDCMEVCKKYDLTLIADAAQAMGASYKGQKVGSLAHISTTSFFPTKPLGCYGDGGMIFTNDDDIARVMRSICFHGKGADKYEHVRIGMNSRLDTLQAAILLAKMHFFEEEIVRRNQLADFYNEHLRGYVTVPEIDGLDVSAWGVYNLRSMRRNEIIEQLKVAGIPSNVYYPTPLHMQPAYKDCLRGHDVSASLKAANEVFCLPMHAYITQAQMEYIVGITLKILNKME
jgi:dTDP-4-amino-4,6-dideoxygalactose transaminase